MKFVVTSEEMAGGVEINGESLVAAVTEWAAKLPGGRAVVSVSDESFVLSEDGYQDEYFATLVPEGREYRVTRQGVTLL